MLNLLGSIGSIFTGLGAKIAIGTSIALLLMSAWAFRLNHVHGVLLAKTNTIVIALKTASGNQKVNLEGAAQQILNLGDEKRQWQETSNFQTQKINEMSAETQRLKARSDELKRIAAEALSKRQAALNKLQNMETTPSEKRDCESLLREANEALDLVYRESL